VSGSNANEVTILPLATEIRPSRKLVRVRGSHARRKLNRRKVHMFLNRHNPTQRPSLDHGTVTMPAPSA
jgi:hypothetical protein